MRTKITFGNCPLPNPHPGEILLEEFLIPKGLSRTELARTIGVSPRRINAIVLGKRPLTADTDLGLRATFRCREAFSSAYRQTTNSCSGGREIGDALKAIRPRAA